MLEAADLIQDTKDGEACRRCWESSEEERDEGNCPAYAALEGKTLTDIAAPQRVARAIISSCGTIERPQLDAVVVQEKHKIPAVSRGIRLLRAVFGESTIETEGLGKSAQYSINHEALADWCEAQGGFASGAENLVSNWCVAGEEVCEKSGPCALYENLVVSAGVQKRRLIRQILTGLPDGLMLAANERVQGDLRVPKHIRQRLNSRSFLKGLGIFKYKADGLYWAQADYEVIASACRQATDVKSDLLHVLSKPSSLKWASQATCLNRDLSLWEPAEPGHAKKTRDIKRAKRICWQQCPVRIDCLREALVQGTPGIRGGYDDWERESISVVRIASKIKGD